MSSLVFVLAILGFLNVSVCTLYTHWHCTLYSASIYGTVWLHAETLKGLCIAKMKNIFFAPAQTKRMQPILESYKAPFRSNLQKNAGPVGAMTLTGPGPLRSHRQKWQSSEK